MNELRIAVVIVTFNRRDMLKKNLESLQAQGPLSFFIIDNNSSDNTQATVEAFAHSTLHPVYYHNTKSNLGGAGGFAYGCKIALAHKDHFTHLWLTDDDVTFHADCLQTLMPFINARHILQPMRFDLNGCNAEASATCVDLKSPFILNHKRNSVMGSSFEKHTEPFDLHSIPFEGPLIPRSVFTSIGLPDHRYFIFSDDLDFAIRARAKGFIIRCVPAAKMTRLKPAKVSRIPNDWKGYFVYRNIFHIQKTFGCNTLVRKRPFLIALLVAGVSLLTGNWRAVKCIYHALQDGMDDDFPINPYYRPK